MKILSKLYNSINQISNNQKFIYIYLLIVLMVTNTILLFTEPMCVVAKFTFILIPIAIQMLLLALVGKPGKMFLFLLPKCILDAFQLVLIVLYGGSVIAVDMFLNLTTTNVTESTELLSNLMPIIVFMLCMYIPAIYLSIRSIRNKNTINEVFRKKALRISGLLLIAGICFFVAAKNSKEGFHTRYDLYPNNVIYNMDFAIKKLHRMSDYQKNAKDFKFNSSHTPIIKDSCEQREIYVLILGETARACNWHIYGYQRNTTPNLDTLQGLIKYTDVLTQSNTTHKIVPLILSVADASNYPIIYSSKSIVTAFKEAGFKTVFLTNQEYNLGFAKHYFNEADIKISVKDAVANSYDHQLLPIFNNIINTESGNLFFIVHLYGSHFNYYQRYTQEFAHYTPDKAPSISVKNKQELINSFDNSIISTDDIISKIIRTVRGKNAISSVLYLSDHGEDMLDDKRNRFLHASPIPTYYQLHIPFLLWFSNEYYLNKKEKVENATNNRFSPISNNAVFHTLLDIASINNSFVNHTLSISSDSFKVQQRNYLTDHDGCCFINQLRMTNFDVQQFKERGLRYY